MLESDFSQGRNGDQKMTQQNLLELAKQGNPKAIALMLNRSLQPKSIGSKSVL